MATGQDSLVAVNDLVLGTVIEMAQSDAVYVTSKFPARYSFVGSDPRVVVPTLAMFFSNNPQEPVPVVTGSKAGIAALSSLISDLAELGLIVDRTS